MKGKRRPLRLEPLRLGGILQIKERTRGILALIRMNAVEVLLAKIKNWSTGIDDIAKSWIKKEFYTWMC